jgi:hypothetical protein
VKFGREFGFGCPALGIEGKSDTEENTKFKVAHTGLRIFEKKQWPFR